jgi:F0F1-type ATP synthase assembly protein I
MRPGELIQFTLTLIGAAVLGVAAGFVLVAATRWAVSEVRGGHACRLAQTSVFAAVGR